LPPQEAIKFGNRCPVCRRSLTKGVEQRVEELADRPSGYKPPNAVGFKHLLPLGEIISTVLGASYPSVQKVWDVYNLLIGKFGDEYAVLMDAPMEQMSGIVEPKVAEAIVRVREEKVHITPGYDGVYGQLVIFEEPNEAPPKKASIKQRRLADFV
jgi:PHP family Zn ribbon phosphoesterase